MTTTISDDSGSYSSYSSSGDGMDSVAHLTKDGRIEMTFDVKTKLPHLDSDHAMDVHEYDIDRSTHFNTPPLNIVIMIVGSRGQSNLTYFLFPPSQSFQQAMCSLSLLLASNSQNMVIAFALLLTQHSLISFVNTASNFIPLVVTLTSS